MTYDKIAVLDIMTLHDFSEFSREDRQKMLKELQEEVPHLLYMESNDPNVIASRHQWQRLYSSSNRGRLINLIAASLQQEDAKTKR